MHRDPLPESARCGGRALSKTGRSTRAVLHEELMPFELPGVWEARRAARRRSSEPVARSLSAPLTRPRWWSWWWLCTWARCACRCVARVAGLSVLLLLRSPAPACLRRASSGYWLYRLSYPDLSEGRGPKGGAAGAKSD